jgi:ubiquinone/menaquinone biosynthesis C-methylase UbiE
MTSSRPERIEKARTLLGPAIPGPGGVWADVGCGDGIFTTALYSLIQPGGEIYAVDKSHRQFQYQDDSLQNLVAPAQDAEALARVLKDPTIEKSTLLCLPADGL